MTPKNHPGSPDKDVPSSPLEQFQILSGFSGELETLKAALDKTHIISITDAQGIIQYVNEKFCLLTKYSREELIGGDHWIINSGHHSKEFMADLWKTISSGSVWTQQIKNKARDNTFFWLDTTIIPFTDDKGIPVSYFAISQNITKQKQEENRITRFFELSTDYLCIIDHTGRFEKVSPVFLEGMGVSLEELTSTPFQNYIIPEEMPVIQQEMEKLAKGQPVINFESTLRSLRREDGAKLISWNASADPETGSLYVNGRDITESKKLSEEHQRLSLVAKSTDNIIIITDKDRKIQWVNRPFELLTGYTLEEALGLNPGPLLQFEDTSPETILEIREALNNKTSFTGDIKNISKGGRVYWLHMVINPVFNDRGELINFIAIETDVTEKKTNELKILNLNATLNAIFNGVGHAVIYTDPNGLIQKVNSAVAGLLEYTEDQLVNKQTPLLFHDAAEISQRAVSGSSNNNTLREYGYDTLVAKARINNSPDANEWTYITRSGKRVPVWLVVSCIRDLDNKILGYIHVAEDYTIKKRAESELIQAKLSAEQAARAKDSFLANMSHEIRTPLNAIIGFTELLGHSSLDEVQSDYVENIKNAGDNLLLIINDILDLSKIESGRLVIESVPFNIKSALSHIYNLLKVKATEKGLEFSLYMDPTIPDIVIGDPGRLNQIIMNLAGNAIKFTMAGEVIIAIKKTSETDEKVTLRFSIKDSGIGIPEEKLASIFDRFTQAEDSTSRRFGGTGLGLNIAKQLLELQHGEISVTSKLGSGSEFIFSLEYIKEKENKTAPQKEKGSRLKSYRKLDVLLCEDNIINQRLAKKVIENFGFDITIANNGREGIDLLQKKHYDLILMDLQMPLMDGYQATIYIRNVLKSDIPIIAMTAHSLIGEQQKCFEIGMNAYVPKPFRQEDLFDKINSVITTAPGHPTSPSSPLSGPDSGQSPGLRPGLRPTAKSVDLVYLKELSHGNQAFEKEMIELFIHKVPSDLGDLQKAISDGDMDRIKKQAHLLKSTMALFNLEEPGNYLVQLENEASNPPLSREMVLGFDLIRKQTEDAIKSLEGILAAEYPGQ